MGMTPEQFFPGWTDEAWQENRGWLVPDHLGAEDDVVQVAFQTWALRSEGRTILVDTGIGNDKTRPAVGAWDHLSLGYLENLAKAGIRPADVDLVSNTHLHVDHVGWNTRLVDGGVNENVFEDSIEPVHAAGQVQLWEGEHVVDGNLRLLAAPGHTPGASVLILTSGSDKALFAGDIVHTPLQVTHPAHDSCFCEDPITAQATRRDLLGWAADNTALVLPAHFSGHTALEVARNGDGFEIKNWGPCPTY